MASLVHGLVLRTAHRCPLHHLESSRQRGWIPDTFLRGAVLRDNMSLGRRYVVHPQDSLSHAEILPGQTVGKVNDIVSPRSGFRVAHIQPPWAAIMDRLRASPRPIPPALVVKKG